MSIQARIDSLHPESGVEWSLGEWPTRVCKERLNALPLHSNSLYIWAIRADGVLLCLDHVDPRPTEPETEPLTIYAVLIHGAQRFPELQELIPQPPTGAQRCPTCEGTGLPDSTAAEAAYSSSCWGCWGLGWVSDPPLR